MTAATVLLAVAASAAAAPLPAPGGHASALLHGRLAQALAARPAHVRSLAPAGSTAAWIEQKVVADGGVPYQQFGASVAIDGATAVVGGVESGAGDGSYPAGPGVAFVLRKQSTGWTQAAELRADDGAAGEFFGFSVAVSGDTAVVGAHDATVDGQADRGAAYVFHHTGDAWAQVARLTAGDGISGDLFGNAVAIDGDTIVVGAYGSTVDGRFGQGALYVFSADGGGWTQTGKLTAADGVALDQLGFSVALHGDELMAGAPNAVGADGSAKTGAVYAFQRSAGAWSQAQKLVPDDGAANDAFGVSVGFEGGYGVVGAPFGNGLLGAAYVFERDATGWAQAQKLLPQNGLPNDVLWAFAVALSGDHLVVTEPTYDSNLGRADVYGRTADGWTLQQTLTASDAVAGSSLADNFGFCGAINGGTILIGQPYSTIGSNLYQGAAYFYEADAIFADGFDAAAQ
jgi:hypothetical protein